MNVNALKELGQFTGTEGYYPLTPFRLLLTDGTKFLAENADCFWLFNEIAGAQTLPKIKEDEMLQDMQFWTLKPNAEYTCKHAPFTVGAMLHSRKGTQPAAFLICERDSGNVAYTKPIPHTDFPFDAFPDKEVRIWVAPTAYKDGTIQVAYLPSEH